jgi:hypothetical protein
MHQELRNREMRFREVITAVGLEVIWTVESLHGISGIGDRDFIMSRTQCIKDSEIAKCDFAK